MESQDTDFKGDYGQGQADDGGKVKGMKEHVILIGFMGAGKTTIGKRLSKKLGVSLLDTDRLIEEEAQITISRIFETKGEEAFRQAETRMLKTLAKYEDKAVISVGGGLPMREENRKILKEMGTVVYLRVRPSTVIKRLKGDTTRPLLQGEDAQKKVRTLLNDREKLYQEAAHLTVDVDGKTVGQITTEIEGSLIQ
jgi:shikimate kinase